MGVRVMSDKSQVKTRDLSLMTFDASHPIEFFCEVKDAALALK